MSDTVPHAAPVSDPERRRGDRRRGDRRRGLDSPGGGESFFDPAWLAGPEAPTASDPQDGSALVRIYRAYAGARAGVGAALIAAQAVGAVFGARVALVVTLLCVAYAAQALTLWLLPRFRALTSPQVPPAQRRSRWVATIGVDLAVFASLYLFGAAASFNYAALLVLPVLMAGVMTQRLLALATAAAVALLLLFVGWRTGLHSGDFTPSLLQSGLAGVGFFALAVLSGELAGRLAREESAARGSMNLALQQAQLNRLVIEEMADGVLVVDQELRVRGANPAARALLAEAGLSPPAPFALDARPEWKALAAAIGRALSDHEWPEAGREATLEFDGALRRTLRVRVRFMRRASDRAATRGESLCVVLLEDVRTALARLRQERLAAMGRVSAGIAHEIRNPLAAISQANALLLEDELPAPQQRLARMVSDNVERLKRIVDDVLELAPGEPTPPQTIDATGEVAATAAEWSHTMGLPLGLSSRLAVDMPAQPLGVSFDTEHLRRVLVNLLDNAHRHASSDAGAIAVRLSVRDENTAQLAVASDGPPIPPEVERHLFEPFFSTRSRGTGLGLYICRELCERYGASIEYRTLPPGPRARNQFLVTMRRARLSAPSTPLFASP